VAYRRLILASDRPAWHRQPGESAEAHRRFMAYCDMPGRRSVAKLAENFGITSRAIEQQAEAHQWRDRAAAYDAHEAEQRRDAVRRQSHRLAVAQIETALGMTQAVARAVRYVLDNNIVLDTPDAARWLDIAAKVAKVAQEQPDITVGLAGPQGGAVEVSIPELEGLTPDAQRQRINEMVASVSRLADYRGAA